MDWSTESWSTTRIMIHNCKRICSFLEIYQSTKLPDFIMSELGAFVSMESSRR
jgi:hypothetical protein